MVYYQMTGQLYGGVGGAYYPYFPYYRRAQPQLYWSRPFFYGYRPYYSNIRPYSYYGYSYQ